VHDPAAAGFLAAIGEGEVAERADDLHARIRRAFGYRRRQLALELVEASASLRTPDFALRLWLEQDGDDPSAWCMPLEVAEITAALLDQPAFLDCFRGECHRLVLALPRPVDVLDRVDAVEEQPALAAGLDYDPRGGWLSLELPAEGLRLRLTPEACSLVLVGDDDLARLIAGSRRLVHAVAGVEGAQFLDG